MAVGKSGDSATERAEKRAALEAAKAKWSDRETELKDKTHFVEGEAGVVRTDDSDWARLLSDREVVHFQKCTGGCRYAFGDSIRLAKVFLEGCESVKLALCRELITGHVEVWRSTGVEIEARSQLGVVQLDLCQGVEVVYPDKSAVGSVVCAGAKGVTLRFSDGSPAYSVPDCAGPDDEQHITQLVDGELLTELVVYGKDNYPTTERQLSKEGRGVASAAERAEAKRGEGNEAFRDENYSQAAVFYTEAITLDPRSHTALANRAACFLKMGQPERALKDSEECVLLAPEYVKGHFRLGLALHAMGRYAEAVPVLDKASNLDPKNKQVRDAVRMAELMARKHAANGGRKPEGEVDQDEG